MSGSNFFTPKPPETITKETIGVWQGWSRIGDKEVVREAAAKGLHVKLAITFLSRRRNENYRETENWFNNEVLKWVAELLERKQIFRASHLLSNIGLNPSVELTKVFYSTTNEQLRNYIGEHLLKTEKLELKLRQLWTFFKLLFTNSDLSSKYEFEKESLECLDNESSLFKSEIATILFFKTFDENLVPFLQSQTLWEFLVENNEINLLKQWVNIRYGGDTDYSTCDLNHILFEQFKIFPITLEMLNAKDLPAELLNEFCKFGILTDKEKSNFLSILKRFLDANSICNLYEIIKSNYSVISLTKFQDMAIDFCLENNFFSILNVCDYQILNLRNSPYLKLICDNRKLVKNFDEKTLSDNIINVSRIYSDDLKSYFNDNKIIVLSLMVFLKEFNKEPLIVHNVDLNEIFTKTIQEMPVLREIFNRKLTGILTSKSTIPILMEKHLEIDTKFLFDQKELPHFNRNIDLGSGYQKKINCLYYLNQGRPNAAFRFFSENMLSLDTFRDKIYKLCLKNYKNIEITASCVSFLEMTGTASDDLKIKIATAKMLEEAQFEDDFIFEILIQNQTDVIQRKLEEFLLAKVDSPLTDGSQLVKALKDHSIVVKFSKLHQLNLPEGFLKYCAQQNLWLPFLIFAQINNYPMENLKILVPYFKNPNLLEHIIHSVNHDIQIEEKTNRLIGDRDSRKYLLSKIGVRQSLENITPTSSITSYSSYGSGASSVVIPSESFEIDVANIKATLLQTLIHCHNSTDPPKALLQACQFYRNPLLAILATSYEPDSKITNWLNWLGVSCELYQPFFNYDLLAVSPNSVSELLFNALKHKYPKTLLESFQIFLPENPLRIFINILNQLLVLNFTEIESELKLFESSMKPIKKYNLIEPDHDLTYLNNKIWIETTALRLLAVALDINCNSSYEQIKILKFLIQSKIHQYFSIKTPNFNNLLKNLQSLLSCDTKIRINIENIFINNREAIINLLDSLMNNKLYDTAMEIAQTENLPLDIILANKFKNLLDSRFETQNFWENIDETFKRYNVLADCVINFYENAAEKLSGFEKYKVLKLACNWAIKYDLSLQNELEIKMWLAFINAEDKMKITENLTIKPSFYLYKDIKEKLKNIEKYKGTLNRDLMGKLEEVLNHSLNSVNFWLAVKLQKMFGCKSSDIEVLKLMANLAEGQLSPYQLNTQQRLLISQNVLPYNRSKTLVSGRFSTSSMQIYFQSAPSFAPTVDVVEIANDTLFILKMLSERLKNGVEIGKNIFLTYRISLNIEIPYHIITPTIDYMKMIKDALVENCANKLEVVHDFIYVFKWTKNEIADFICEELVNVTTNYVLLYDDELKMWDLPVDSNFNVILQLLQDNCSILGNKLFSYANTLHKSNIEKDSNEIIIKDLILICELLIRSHDCFTADCNMEGISMVLKQCRKIITDLVKKQNWKLIVRLLTGVARYSEMSYVFGILLENDQFEFLLSKNTKRDNSLKVALLDYLKKYSPDNRDLFHIVALHFTLFSEVALLWENEAKSILKNLITISKLEMQNNKMNPDNELYILFENNEDTKKCLNKAMENYIHATEFHIQGDKLTKAINSANQAELIALQLHLLGEVVGRGAAICILELTTVQIATLLSSKLNFYQSQILIRAFNFLPDWSTILYQQYIVRNNSDYFKDFLKHNSLTDGVISEISKKFIAGNNGQREVSNMREILNKSSSVCLKYRIASELGFTDIVEDMLKGDKLVYLKDTVWKRGYTSN